MSDNKLTVKNSGFAITLSDEILKEVANSGGGLEKVRIPAGGGMAFEFPNLENADETVSIKEFSAVILFYHPLSTYYKEKYNGQTVLPDCMSFDRIVGNTGELCKSCKYNTFGSGKNGGKACKTKEQIYILREGDMFPMAMVLPTGSVRGFHTYKRRLPYNGKTLSTVVTKFTLKRATNKTGIVYSQVNFTAVRDLEKVEIEAIKNLVLKIKTLALEASNVGIQTSNNDTGN